MSEIHVSQTVFKLGDDQVRGVPIPPGLVIDYHPADEGDFLTPAEAGALRDWLNKHYPAPNNHSNGEPK